MRLMGEDAARCGWDPSDWIVYEVRKSSGDAAGTGGYLYVKLYKWEGENHDSGYMRQLADGHVLVDLQLDRPKKQKTKSKKSNFASKA